MDENIFSIFKKNPLLEGLKEEELKALFAAGQRVYLHKGSCLIREGDPASEIFFLIEGTLTVSKEMHQTGISHTIATLSPGALVGEIALLDKGTRSANVIAVSDASLIAIPFAALEVETDGPHYKVLLRIARNMSDKLRKTGNKAMAALADQVEECNKRLFLGDVFIATLLFICTYFYIVLGLSKYAKLPDDTFYFTLPLTLSFMLGMVWIVKKYKLPWKTFGVTLDGWKKAAWTGFLTTIPVSLLMVAAKWVKVHYLDGSTMGFTSLFEGHLEPFQATIYLLLIVPLQELLARGGLQGILTEFLSGEYKIPKAIFASSIIFGSAHLFMSFKIAIIVLFLSFYLGWLYAKTRNLISVWISHGLLGIWGLGILGI